MHELKDRLFGCLKRNKGYFVFLLILTISMMVIAVISAINFDGGILSINFTNVPYIRFLKDECSFISLIFSLILTIAIILLPIFICHCRKLLYIISLIFYCYFIYSQVVILTSIILIYGFFNTLILIIVLSIYLLTIVFLLILIMTELSLHSGSGYFQCCFNGNNNFILLSIILILSIVLFSLILTILKSFVMLLIF